MSKPDVFMPLYIGDYLAGTSRLSAEQHGAYLLLIMDYWMNGALPDDDVLLANIARLTPDAWSMHKHVLMQFFIVSEGKWTHKRIEEELQRAQDKKTVAQEKAAKAAKARWEKEKNSKNDASSNATSITQAMHKECPSPSPSPSPSKNKNIPPKSPKGDELPEDFEEFWDAYPKRVNKSTAVKAFKRLKPDSELLEKIFADLRVRCQTEDWRKEDGKFIPHPSTYLNQRRWEDEIKPKAVGKKIVNEAYHRDTPEILRNWI